MGKVLGVPIGLLLLVAGILTPVLWFDAVLYNKMSSVEKTVTDAVQVNRVLNNLEPLHLTPSEEATPSVKKLVPAVKTTESGEK